MKVSVFPALLAVILTAALTYWAYYIGQEDENIVLLTIGTAVTIFFTLGVAMSVRFPNARVGLSIKTFAVLSFVVMFASNLFFACLGVNAPLYVIWQTILLVTFFFVFLKLTEKKNV